MSVREILHVGHPLLRERSVEVPPGDIRTPAMQSLIDDKINLMPRTVKAHESEDWLSRDKSQIKDLIAIAKTTDWSFSTPYKGTVL